MLPPVDWSRPWLAPYREIGQRVAAAVARGASVAAALNAEPGAPVRFVPQAELPRGQAYEAFIARTRRVPTRENLHDFFNGLVWHAEPALKLRLNGLQAAAIAVDGIGPKRGALRDALTLFDENGALLDLPPALHDALQRRDWHRLFVTGRGLWRQVRRQLIGHALMEQLATAPRKGLAAHALTVPAVLALQARDWAAKPFAPLPVAGVPGWWPGNDEPGFYDDDAVFRPAAGGAWRAARNLRSAAAP